MTGTTMMAERLFVGCWDFTVEGRVGVVAMAVN